MNNNIDTLVRTLVREVIRDEVKHALADALRVDEFLSTSSAAKFANCSTNTIRRWVKGGVMPDIAMCKGVDGDRECPIRKRCYRHTATPSEHRQSYFAGVPYDDATKNCDYHWPTKKGDRP